MQGRRRGGGADRREVRRNCHVNIEAAAAPLHCFVWNKGRIVDQKRQLLPRHVRATRLHLELVNDVRVPALFNMAVDSKHRGCDFVCLKIADVVVAARTGKRSSILQSKTQRPGQFENCADIR